jgi:dTDP-4-dehydrorhamnose reductase
MQKIIVTGKNGQVGHALVEALSPLCELHAFDSQAFDLINEVQIRDQIQAIRPDIIINAAAYTAVDRAETDEMAAFAINAHGLKIIGQEAAKIGAVVIHFSTDYVFDGKKVGPYVESDKTNPLGMYGASKWQGEILLLGACPQSVILRTTWVVSSHGNNFAKTMLKLAAERESLNVVADQFGVPTPAKLLAEAVTLLISKLEKADKSKFPFGCYHFAPSGETNWCDYARFVIEESVKLGVELKLTPDNIRPIRTEEYPTPAKRPHNSRLDCGLFQQTFAFKFPSWESGILDVIQDIYKAH